MVNVFLYYTDMRGEPLPAKTQIEDKVYIGGRPREILQEFVITDDEYQLPLSVLAQKYPAPNTFYDFSKGVG